MPELLTDDQINTALAELTGWVRDGYAIKRNVTASSFAEGIALVDRVAAVADERDHHPDIDIRWRTTRWLLSTHDAGGLTQLDIELAHRISAAARAQGATLGG